MRMRVVLEVTVSDESRAGVDAALVGISDRLESDTLRNVQIREALNAAEDGSDYQDWRHGRGAFDAKARDPKGMGVVISLPGPYATVDVAVLRQAWDALRHIQSAMGGSEIELSELWQMSHSKSRLYPLVARLSLLMLVLTRIRTSGEIVSAEMAERVAKKVAHFPVSEIAPDLLDRLVSELDNDVA